MLSNSGSGLKHELVELGRVYTVRNAFVLTLLAALVLYLFHLTLGFSLRSGGYRLGAVSWKSVPFYAYWRPHFKGWLLLAALVLLGYLGWLRRTRLAIGWREYEVHISLFLWHMAVASAVCMIDGGPGELVEPFGRTDLEYTGAVELVGRIGPLEFLQKFPELLDELPMHAKVHPPGAVLVLWLVDRLLGPSVWWKALFVLTCAAASTLAVYVLAAELADRRVARIACTLYIVCPSVCLFSATSMDAVFCCVLLWSVALWYRALKRGSAVFGFAAGLLLAAGSLLTYAAATVALLLALAWAIEPTGCRNKLRLATSAVIAACVTYAGLVFAGYRPLDTFLSCSSAHYGIMRGSAFEEPWRWALIAVCNLVAFGAACGLCCVSFCLYRLFAGPARPESLRRFLCGGLATLVVFAIAPVFTLEVERIWMFAVPVVLVPVAYDLSCAFYLSSRPTLPVLFLWLTALQTLGVEIFWETYW